jgi:hypothetical protein
VESHKLDPWPLDESSIPKSGKSRLNLRGTIMGGKLIGLDPQNFKIKLKFIKTRAHDLENQDAS